MDVQITVSAGNARSELDLMTALNSVLHAFTTERPQLERLPPESVNRAVAWLHAKWQSAPGAGNE
jgi:hypothetical protein